MTNKNTRIKAPAVTAPIPSNASDAAKAIANIGINTRELTRIEAAMADEIALVKERYENQAVPIRKQIEELTTGVQVYCEAHRSELLKGDAKTASFATGEVQWRVRPPSCRIKGSEAVLDLLRRMGLSRFIRSKEEVNKEAILNEPDAVKGVAGISIEQGEDFVIKPFEVELVAAS